MYELSGRWRAYYEEQNLQRRRNLLVELMRSEPDDGANRYRLMLLEARHGADRKAQGEVDRFLFQFINLVQIYRSARFFKRSATRETEKMMRDLLWDEAVRYGEAGESALYWEMRNAAMRYFKTCEGSGYNRALFGAVASGEAGRADRICQEVWQMTEGLVERTGLQERLRIWNQAVVDAYARFDGSALKRLEEYKAK